MAYDADAAVKIAPSRDGSKPTIWAYSSADPMATVTGSGYFANATNIGMKVGDIVLVNESDNDYAPVMAVVSGITTGAATVSAADRLEVEAGAGITAGTGTVYKSSVTRSGDIITTRIFIDLTGLNCGGTAGDVIGVDGTGTAHLGQITTARNGTLFAGTATCLETPATGDADIDIYSAEEATGVEDTAISVLTETQLLDSAGFAITDVKALTALPAADEYLYLVGQGTGDATYTAGKLLIELHGYI